MPIDLVIYVCLNSEIFALKENDIEVIQCNITILEFSTLNKKMYTFQWYTFYYNRVLVLWFMKACCSKQTSGKPYKDRLT